MAASKADDAVVTGLLEEDEEEEEILEDPFPFPLLPEEADEEDFFIVLIHFAQYQMVLGSEIS